METYKTLTFKDELDINTFGKYAVIYMNGFGGCSIPELMNKQTTLKNLKQAYPNINFNDVNLITVNLTEVKKKL